MKRPGAVPLLLGGVAWLPVRWGVMTTWNGTWLGLDYVGWNRMMLLPLGLLFVGAAAIARRSTGGGLVFGWWAAAAGFLLAAAGVTLEFIVGGGLRGGPRILAMAGWGVYGLGTLIAAIGGAAAGWAYARRRAMAASAASIVVALAMMSWLPLIAAGLHAVAVANQLVVGAAWAALAGAVARHGKHLSPA